MTKTKPPEPTAGGLFGPADAPDRDLVLIDGDCTACDRFAAFALQGDRDGRLRFASLGGATARAALARAGVNPDRLPDSVVVLRGMAGPPLLRSDAVFYVLRQLGPGWRLAARAGRFIPRPIRDLGYRAIATARGWLPLSRRCPLLPPDLRARIVQDTTSD